MDADGRSVRMELTAGQAADAPMAEKLLSGLRPGATLLADKAYDTDAIRRFAKQRKCCKHSRQGQPQTDLQLQPLGLSSA
ncbi:transposase (plasmid) [Agrobacterium salinitolerans]|nr:transposase [Agrobacterium salinitolerans]